MSRVALPVPLPATPVRHWHPGFAGARHSEVFVPAGEASGVAMALALAREEQGEGALPWLWVQDRAALRLTGRPYRPGLPQDLRARLLHVAAATPADALFAIEEALRCRELAWVIGEIAGNPKTLDFTASRRLSLTAERHGVPLYLVRPHAARDLSSARMRWQVRAAPSLPEEWDPAAPGRPAWHGELFRARGLVPGEWMLRDDRNRLLAAPATAPDHGDLAGAAGDRSLAAG